MSAVAEPTTVYIARKGRRVLYVGITGRNLRRMHAHARASEWWTLASRIELQHLPTRTDAEVLERKLIAEWAPPFNVAHNDPSPDPDLLDLEALTQQTGLSAGAAKRIIRALPTVTLGQRRYVRRADVTAYIDAHTYPAGTLR